MKNDDLFAPPSNEELQDDDLFAAPSELELEGISDEVPVGDIATSVAGGVGGAVAGLGAKKLTDPITDKLGDLLSSKAESMAYTAIGGETTAEGKQFLKDQLKELGETPDRISTKSIGRRALDEGLVDIFSTSGGNFDKAEKNLLESIKNKGDILSKIKSDADLSEVAKNMMESMDVDPILGGTYDQKVQSKTMQEADILRGRRSLPQVEKQKTKIQKRLSYSPDKLPLDSADTEVLRNKASALRKTTEDVIGRESPEILEEFLENKRATGERGIMRNILLDKSFKDRVSPAIGLRDIATTGVGGPAFMATDKVLRKKGASAAAKSLEGLSKMARKLGSALPVVGSLIGSGVAYNEARAAGLDPIEAATKAATEEGVEAVMGLGSLALPETTGPRRNSLEAKLERVGWSGLSPEEREALTFKGNGTTVSPIGSSIDKMKTLSDEELQDKGETLMSKNPELGQKFLEASKLDGLAKTQQMWALSQNPEVRKVINREPSGKIYGYPHNTKVPLDDSDLTNFEKQMATSEGYVPEIYEDSLGKATIGIGHLLTDEERKSMRVYGQDISDGVDEKEAKFIFRKDLEKHEKDLQPLLDDMKIDRGSLSEDQLNAIRAMLFQLGPNTARDFKDTLGKVSRGDYEGAASNVEKSLWNKQTPDRVDYFQENIQKIKDIDAEIDRVNQQQSSGDDVPINQLDALLEKINTLQLPQDQIDMLEDEAVAMESFADGQRLKELLQKVTDLS